MRIRYEFVTGEIVEIEVPNNIGEVSIELDRAVYNSNHRETRRHNSIENLQDTLSNFHNLSPYGSFVGLECPASRVANTCTNSSDNEINLLQHMSIS